MKHVPERTCCACGAKKPQRDLLRIASSSGATPQIDVTGKSPGRGSYLCQSLVCAEKALARRAFERTLKLNEPLPDDFKTELKRVVRDKMLATEVSSL